MKYLVIRRAALFMAVVVASIVLVRPSPAVVITHGIDTILFADDFESAAVGSTWNNGTLAGTWVPNIQNSVSATTPPGPFEGDKYGVITRTASGQGMRATFSSVDSGRLDLDTTLFIPSGMQWLSIVLGNGLGLSPQPPASNIHSYVIFNVNSSHSIQDYAAPTAPMMNFQYKNNEWMRLKVGYDFDNQSSGYTVGLTTTDGTFTYTRGLLNSAVPIDSMLIKFEANGNTAYFDAAQPIPSVSHSINLGQAGRSLNHKIFGQAVPTSGGSEAFEHAMNDSTVGVAGGASIRGVAGGLSADTYDWKLRTGSVVGEFGVPGRPTLEYLRYARNENAELFITVNTRGTGTGVSSQDFVWQSTNATPLASLAADWVRYANKIVPQYRQGDALSPSDAAIVNSLTWGNYDRLLANQEPATSSVKYWEIGNEPDVGITDSHGTAFDLTPAQYADRYVQISTAMLAQDPTIKVGPVVKRGVNDAGNAPDPWLLAVLARPDARVDFISYHPYQNIFDPYLSEGTLPTPQSLEIRLRGVKQKQNEEYSLIQSAIQTNNTVPSRPQRSLSTPTVASEWNVSSQNSNGTFVARSVGHALGSAETMFTYAENSNMLAAQYWVWPVKYWEGTPTPLYRLYQALEAHAGDTLVESYSDGNSFRMYTTTDTTKREIALWGLNFSDTADKLMKLSLINAKWNLNGSKVTLMRLAHTNGSDLSLLDSTSANASDPLSIDWISTDLTGQIDFSNFQLNFEDATITLLLITSPNTLVGDYDENGIVDAADYVVWRKRAGSSSELPNDPIGGIIGSAQYAQWRANFGKTIAGGQASNNLPAAVPEPSILGLLSAIGWLAILHRRHSSVLVA